MRSPYPGRASRSSLPQYIAQHSRNDRTIESAAAEQSRQPPLLHVTCKCAHRCSFALDQLPSTSEFGVAVDILKCHVDVAALDSLGFQFSLERRTRKVASLLPGGDPVNCEGCIVNQTHLLQPVEDRFPDAQGHVLGLKRLVKLVSGVCPRRQFAQRDGASHRHRVCIVMMKLGESLG